MNSHFNKPKRIQTGDVNLDTTKPVTVDQFRELFGNASIGAKSIQHEESLLQQACVEWFYRNPYTRIYWLIKVKNEGKMGGKTVIGKDGKEIPLEAIIAKREGLRKGVADLQLIFGNGEYYSLFLEVKTKAGTQSKEQKEFEAYCKQNKFKYVIVRSVENFIRVIEEYMSLTNLTQ